MALDLTGGHAVIFRLLPEYVHHLPDDGHRLLKVGVDDGDEFAPGGGEPGGHGGFLSEVPGKAEHLDGAGPLLKQLPQLRQGAVAASVVHEHNLKGDAAAVKFPQDLLLEPGRVSRLVEAGDHQGQVHRRRGSKAVQTPSIPS